MRLALACLIATGLLAAEEHGLPLTEAQGGWLLLFDNETLFGWTAENGAGWQARGSQLVSSRPGGLLRTNSAFTNFTLSFEFRAGAGSEGEIVFRWDGEAATPQKGYALQLGGATPGAIRGLPKHGGAAHITPEAWHKAELKAIADAIAVSIDGETTVDAKDTRYYRGLIALAHTAGPAIAFRNIKLKPERLDSLFNGKDLNGWQTVNPPPPQKKQGGPLSLFKKIPFMSSKPQPAPVWSVTNGAIHVQGGPGLLAYGATYDDFTLQLEIRTESQDSKHFPDAGVYFRTDPKAYGSGYESQINNEYSGKGGAQPARYGTGGLTGIIAARRVVSRDNQYFVKTIVASGRHIGVWIDGYQVTDYYDSRAEAATVDAGARTAAGAIALEAHDGGTLADFRNLRGASFPKGPAVAAAAAAPTAPPASTSASQPSLAAPPGIQPPAAPPGSAIPAPPQPGQDPKTAQVAALTMQALKEPDPKKQVDLYEQILSIDPNNQVANANRKEALDTIRKQEEEAARKAQQAAAEAQKHAEQAQQSAAVEAQKEKALGTAESAIESGDLDKAANQIAAARKVAPADPEVRRLDNIVSSRLDMRKRLRISYGSAAGAALLLCLVTFWRTRGSKEPYLEILEGFEKGRRYALQPEVTHIGAIPEDGGQKNEIVIRDAERMISRFHCQIHRRGKKLYLVDCKSANGTWLDRKRMKPGNYVRVKNGAKIELGGSSTIRIGFEKPAKKAAAAAS